MRSGNFSNSSRCWLIGRFPLIKGNDRLAILPMTSLTQDWTINTQSYANWLSIGCQWTPNLLEIESQSTNSVSFAVKNTRLVLIQVCKGTTLENFLRDLSTNEKPAFRPLDQSEASVSARFSLLAKSEVYQSKANVPIDCQWNVTELQLECQLNAKGLPIDVNWLLMECPSTTNGMPIDCQWIANWWPMEW